MSNWFDNYLARKEDHDCDACSISDTCPLKHIIPRLDEVIRYIELHLEELELFMDCEEAFVDHVLDILHKLGPILDKDDVKGMFVILLLEGYVRGRQYVEVPDAYKK